MKKQAEDAQGHHSAPCVASDPVLDVAQALERMDGDRGLLEELAHLFAGEWPKSAAEINAALKVGDAALLERLAHGLKGAAANVGAERLSTAALRMEKMSAAQNLKSIPAQWEIVKEEAAALLEEFERLFREAAH